jgi:hypothetical protein
MVERERTERTVWRPKFNSTKELERLAAEAPQAQRTPYVLVFVLTALGVVLLVCLAVLLFAADECTARGNVFVPTFGGGYTCVRPATP